MPDKLGQFGGSSPIFWRSADPAWDENIELGLLVRDTDLARRVTAHLQKLIDTRTLWKLPSETGSAAA